MDGLDSQSQLEERLYARQIASYEDLEQGLLETYDDICGEYGRAEFIQYVLSRLRTVYGKNINKAGITALEIIDAASEETPDRIGSYIKQQLEREVQAVERGLPSMDGIANAANALLKNLENRTRKEYRASYNVCGMIVYGSFAKNQNHPGSDLDVALLTRDDSGGDTSDFVSKLEAETELDVELWDDIVWNDDKKLASFVYGEDSLVKGKYRVVSPFGNIKGHVEKTLQDYTANI